MLADLAITTGFSKLTPSQLMILSSVFFVSCIVMAAVVGSVLGDASCGFLLNLLVIAVFAVAGIVLLDRFYQQVRLVPAVVTILVAVGSGFAGIIFASILRAVSSRD